MLRGDAIKRIALALDIPPALVMSSANGIFSISDSEKDLIKDLRQLPEPKKVRVRRYVEFELVCTD